ncbi:MAG: hypothetical protein ABFD81_14665 [Syntrophaceae bacterium]
MVRLWQGYFALLGVAVLFCGLLEFLAAAAGHQLACPLVVFSTGAFRGLWGGLVTIFSGIFLLKGLGDFGEVHQLGKLLIGCILLWIMAGTDIFALIAAAIPNAQPELWLNSLPVFLESLAPPYTPAITLLPFSLPIIICLRIFGGAKPPADGGHTPEDR